MTIILLLIIAVLLFGLGTLIEGLLWLTLIGVIFVVAAGVFGARTLRR